MIRDDNSTFPPVLPGGWKLGSWRIPSDHLPLLIGAFCGGAFVLLLIVVAILWKCCSVPRREKEFCNQIEEHLSGTQRLPTVPSNSAVFLTPKSGHWCYNSQLISASNSVHSSPGSHWFYNNRILGPASLERIDCNNVPRSASCVPAENQTQVHRGAIKKRRFSQPIKFGSCDISDNDSHPVHLSEICEFDPHHPTQYASSSILDEGGPKDKDGSVLKTRSLPAWVRSKSRPLSTEDNISELYAKVNFSKKRKNRMRNDEAAIIALSKSRSQFFNKDTDSLVDNEAVIVYNERTAL